MLYENVYYCYHHLYQLKTRKFVIIAFVLQVMRMIQSKLSNSKEQLENSKTTEEISSCSQKETASQVTSQTFIENNSEAHTQPKKRWSPPSINMGTWSQRQKTPVALKEDDDYKINTTNVKPMYNTPDYSKVNGTGVVSIRVNSSEPIVTKPAGNVIIKIGGGHAERSTMPEPISNMTPDNIYRRPMGGVNKLGRSSRPHSIAIDPTFDNSRVPVVRSVELKKPFKDLQNKNVARIYTEDSSRLNTVNVGHLEHTSKTDAKNSFRYISNENLGKPMIRNLVQNPTVVTFKPVTFPKPNVEAKVSYDTLPKIVHHRNVNVNSNVPFSQNNLRRTESSKRLTEIVDESNIFGKVVSRSTSTLKVTPAVEIPVPPSPPILKMYPSKTHTSLDEPREELLNAIRNFGGRNGLKSTRV